MDTGERRLRAVLAESAAETGLNARAIDVIAESAQIAYFREGAVIERANRPSGLTKFVISGVVRLTYKGMRPDPVIVRFVKPGLPMVTVFERGGKPAFTAYAHRPSGIAFVAHELITEVVAGLGEKGALKFARYSWSVMSDLLCDKCELLTRNVGERLLHELGVLARDFGRPHDGGTLIDLSLTQDDLARLVAVDRSTVNRNLKQFERDGIVGRSTGRYVLMRSRGAKVDRRAS